MPYLTNSSSASPLASKCGTLYGPSIFGTRSSSPKCCLVSSSVDQITCDTSAALAPRRDLSLLEFHFGAGLRCLFLRCPRHPVVRHDVFALGALECAHHAVLVV